MASPDGGKVEESEKPREQLINTAVKFLQNPKVRDSPFPQRRKFLKQKGLTDDEIQIAIDRSGTAGDEALHPADSSPNQSQPVVAGNQLVPTTHTAPVTRWSRFRDFTSTAILVGGVSYAVYMILKHYLAPHLFGPSREEKRLQKLSESVTQLQDTVASMLQTLQQTQKTLTEQQDTLRLAVVDSAAGRGSKEMVSMQNTQFVNEIKEEVKSLKGLLLSRRQFPTAPTTAPVLPAWQLQTNSQSETPTESSNGGSMETTDPHTSQSQESVEQAVNSSEPSVKTEADGIDQPPPVSSEVTTMDMSGDKTTKDEEERDSDSVDKSVASNPSQQPAVNGVMA